MLVMPLRGGKTTLTGVGVGKEGGRVTVSFRNPKKTNKRAKRKTREDRIKIFFFIALGIGSQDFLSQIIVQGIAVVKIGI